MKHSSSALLSAVECIAPPGRCLTIGTDKDFQNLARLAGFQIVGHYTEEELPTQSHLPTADCVICALQGADVPQSRRQVLAEYLCSAAPKQLLVCLSASTGARPSLDELAKNWTVTFHKLGLRPHASMWRKQKLADGTYLLCYERPSRLETNDKQAPPLQNEVPSATSLSRYHLAARFVAQGETVVDLACGTGEGAAVIAHTSFATRVVSLSLNADSIPLAERALDEPNLPCSITKKTTEEHLISPKLVDVVISLNEHLRADQVFNQLEMANMELRPGARVILAIDARDAVGGPNLAWSQFETRLSDSYLVGARYSQVGTRMTRIPVQETYDGPVDAWLAVVHKSPFHAHLTYTDNLASFVDSGGHAADRALGFEQPWLIPALVRRKTRPKDVDALLHLARSVPQHVAPEAVDVAAALCVEGYLALEAPPEQSIANALFDRMETWLEGGYEHAPAYVRWSISLWYVKARLHLLYDDIDAALRCFEACLAAPFMTFDPTLATKVTQAGNEAARLTLGKDRLPQARSHWQAVVNVAAEALAGTSPVKGCTPPPYLFSELADVAKQADWAARCLNYVQTPKDYVRLMHLSKKVGGKENTAETEAKTKAARQQAALEAARLEHQNQWSSISRLASERLCILHPSPITNDQAPRLILPDISVFEAGHLYIKVATPNPAPENAGARLTVICEHPNGTVWRTQSKLPPHAQETLAIELGTTDHFNSRPNVIKIEVHRASETAGHQASAVHLSGFWIAP